MQDKWINKPISVNLDKSKKYLTPTEAFYMLNRERNINGTGTLGKTTPLVANYLACMVDQPAGDNYNNGHCFSEETNELYWWTFNTNGVHYVGRLNGDGTCQIVYDGDCLPLSAAPEHSIEEWRCELKHDRFCANQHGKQLIWTNGEHEIGMLDVEASIATDSFRTPFFTDFCPDPCAYTEMCVPEPCGALEGEFIALTAGEADLNNHMVDIGIKVAFIQMYYDQREATMSDISTLFYQDSKGCFDAEEGFPRCLKLTVPLGNPMVDKIEIIYSTDNGFNWKSSDIIEKYEPYINSNQYWYERELKALPDLDLVNCTFSYNFCNDKECNPVDPKRTSRVFNPMPRKPQGFIRIKNALGFYNYLEGNCPVSGTEVEKFKLSLDCDNPNNCVEEIATVTVRAIVHNLWLNRNAPIWRLLGNVGDVDDLTGVDAAVFGASFHPEGMGQYFSGKTRNFIPYIDATNTWGQMKQWRADAGFLNKKEVGVIAGMDIRSVRDGIFGEIDNGRFYYEEYSFKVKKGSRGYIRIAGHSANNGLPSEGQDTSTFVFGTIPNLNLYSGNMVINSIMTYRKEEIYFDTCAGDVTLDETFVIEDGYKLFENGAYTSCAYSGYLTDANNVPIEGAQIWYDGLAKSQTDHNGFYHFSLFGANNNRTIAVDVRVETNCAAGFNTVKSVTLHGGYGQMRIVNIQVTDIDFPNYKNGYYETVTIPVKDCDNLPVGGVRISLSGSKYQVTDAVTGIATFKVRNYSTRNRSVMGGVVDLKDCFTLDCSNACNPCLPITVNTALPACFLYPPHTTNVPTTTNLNKLPALTKGRGLKSGGRYPFTFVVKGSCGKISSAYPMTIMNGILPALDNYMNIPKTQEKNILSFCSFDYDATGMVLPDWAECVAICRGENVNNYELQWVVDKIERTKDRKIRLTIQSLNDYNASYNFETNTIYQYIKDDRIEFINNGNGDIFDIATYGLLNYQILSPFHDKAISGETTDDTKFFNQLLIDDDGKLGSLTIGAKIELQRPKECTVKPTYYAVAHLDVIEISGQRVLANPTGTFTTFDTFIVIRQIDNSNTQESNPPQQFEHKFPSDFWGHKLTEGVLLGLSDIGKAYFSNPFENQKRAGRNISINSPIRFNRFGDLVKTFDAPEHGDIIAMGVYDDKIGLVIGQFDSALFQTSDEFLRVNNAGLVIAASADALVSDTQPKVSGIFGCRYQSIGSIYFGDGYVTWMDIGKMAYVKHDFNIAKDISQGKFNTWVKKTVQFMENFNRTATDINKYRFFTGMNYHTGALQLTAKSLTQSGGNNEIEPFINMASTILINPETEELLTFASYLQEGYSNIVLNDDNGCAFVSFLNGIPFIHPVIPIKFNEFNGVAYDCIVGISAHHETPDKEINPFSIEIQSGDFKWYAKKVSVDNPSFESEIPPIRVNKVMDKFNASFLCDKNSRGGLYSTDVNVSGKKPRGYFCAITLVRDNTIDNQYNSINNAKRILFDELDLIITKYSFAENSGMTNNL